MNGALAWRALITRYAPNTAPRVQSLMSAILNVKTFPSELTAYEIALDEWQENIRKWGSISGERFNVSMKKALFPDKALSSVRVPQMQNLETFAAMPIRVRSATSLTSRHAATSSKDSCGSRPCRITDRCHGDVLIGPVTAGGRQVHAAKLWWHKQLCNPTPSASRLSTTTSSRLLLTTSPEHVPHFRDAYVI